MTRRVLPVEFVARRPFEVPVLSGFNLLELLATLALLGSLLGVSVSSWQRDKPQVGAGVQTLAADLLWARSEAVRLHTPVRVTFDAASARYRVTYENTNGKPQVALERDLKRHFPLVDLAAPGRDAAPSFLFDARGAVTGSRSTLKLEVGSSLDATFRSCVFVEPKGLITYSQTCAL